MRIRIQTQYAHVICKSNSHFKKFIDRRYTYCSFNFNFGWKASVYLHRMYSNGTSLPFSTELNCSGFQGLLADLSYTKGLDIKHMNNSLSLKTMEPLCILVKGFNRKTRQPHPLHKLLCFTCNWRQPVRTLKDCQFEFHPRGVLDKMLCRAAPPEV